MKIIRYQDASGGVGYAADQGDGTALRIEGDIFGAFTVTKDLAKPVRLLAPIVPTTVMCTGMNYRQHAAETGATVPEYPVLFVKGLNSVQNPAEPIVLPRFLRSDEVDYECELAVVIGKSCKNVRAENALEYVAGYTCANDVSARDWQMKRGGSQWCRGKFFDTFCPLGPALVTPEDIPNPNALRIRTILNGAVVQDSTTADMIFSVAKLIEFYSGSSTLLPGTVILTGTPSGVGMARKPPLWLKDGDSVTIEIEKIGLLTNPVVDEAIA
jgi:2-keto-4-pentenoate hydratase/2-oxohepta-3-ene-1,7-dioic acid hydratase in catechol pathway